MLYIHTGWNLYTGQNLLKRAGMAETDRNGPNFNPRWNIRVFRTGLLTGMKFSSRSGWNKTESSTMLPRLNIILIDFAKPKY